MYAQDRGSIVQYGFLVKHGSEILGNDSIYYSESGYGWGYTGIWTNNDTIIVELVDTSLVEIGYSYYDEYYRFCCYEVFWQKSNVLMDSSSYYFEHCDVSTCAVGTWFNTSLSTRDTGVYRLELCQVLGWKSVYVLIKEKEPEVQNVETSERSAFNLYPNPAENEFSVVHGPVNNGSIIIFDSQGKLIFKEIISNGDSISRIDTYHLAPGMYSVHIRTDVHGLITKKLIIAK